MMRRLCLRSLSVSLAAAAVVATTACGDDIPGEAGLCGNGTLEANEECDDGNNNDGDGCSAGCLADGECGNSIVEGIEECDDGNTDGGDGCSAQCQNESANNVCGDGVVGDAEMCDDGNAVEFDGCEDDCTPSPAEVACADLPPATTGICDVVSGGDGQLISGDILTPGTILRGGQVAVDFSGQITCVGCDCETEAAGATTVTCPGAIVSPGLINPHDHITFVDNPPYTDTGERYEHRHDWRRGRNGHTPIDTSGGASGNDMLYGELRFLMGGATSVIGAGAVAGFLRNLDRDLQEGLSQPPVELDTFPLGDTSGIQLSDGCNYPNITDDADIASEDAYSPHVSEGIDTFARNEFLCVSRTDNGGEDLLESQSAFIHGAALTPFDYTTMTDQGTLLIWSPRSNITLYGNTATVTTADRVGVPIALGTDWLPTGSMNLLRELQCADSLNRDYYGNHFSDKDLWEMVTLRAAQAAAMDDAIGALLPGRAADIAIFNASTNSDYRAIIDAQPEDVALVMRGGESIYGDEGLIAALSGSGCDVIDVCSVSKRVCSSSETGMSFSELETAANPPYGLFFCGEPDNEPSCVPTRPESVNGSTTYTGIAIEGDADGDGVADAEDNCSAIFNPIRPLDNGVQADFDDDGEGDACDECPMDSGVTDCLPFNEADIDADGIANDDDNCPEVANADQADGDSDDRGDVCDQCPASANPAPVACPASIYEVKTGETASTVSMTDALVTVCVAGTGFFLQVHEDDDGYAGTENSGVFVFSGGINCGVQVSAGDRIDITPSAQVGNFFGQTQLSNAMFTVQSSANPLPAPVTLTTAEASGDEANAFEAVLATVLDVGVTEVNPPAGPGDNDPTNAFVVDDILRVDDFVFATANFPAVGALYESITGVLAYRNNRQKLHPRSEADLVAGPPTLIGFAPDGMFVREGDNAAPTFPQALTVTLSSPPIANTLIAITSSNNGALTVEGGGAMVLAGETTATVQLNGLAQAASVTLTAELDGDQLSADVRVIGAAEVNSVIDLQPDGQTASPGSTVEMTVTLDFPAPAGGTVVAVSIAPGATGSTVPANVTVNENAQAATFTFSAGVTPGDETVTATLGASSVNAAVTVGAAGSLVISEIDYDQPGADNDEYIEIFNGSGAAVDLSDFTLVLANGSAASQSEYFAQQLTGSLAAGQYLVVGSDAAIAATDPGALTIVLGSSIQNGSPDGVALMQISSGAVADVVAYENGGGTMTAISTTDFGTVNYIEGTATDVTDNTDGAICRDANNTDTDDSDADWAFCPTSTPGTANTP